MCLEMCRSPEGKLITSGKVEGLGEISQTYCLKKALLGQSSVVQTAFCPASENCSFMNLSSVTVAYYRRGQSGTT